MRMDGTSKPIVDVGRAPVSAVAALVQRRARPCLNTTSLRSALSQAQSNALATRSSFGAVFRQRVPARPTSTELTREGCRRRVFVCIGCGSRLVAHLKDDQRARHFAHYGRSLCTSYETYLHQAGKAAFVETYRECVRAGRPFVVRMPVADTGARTVVKNSWQTSRGLCRRPPC
jgi:hypothetical protein